MSSDGMSRSTYSFHSVCMHHRVQSLCTIVFVYLDGMKLTLGKTESPSTITTTDAASDTHPFTEAATIVNQSNSKDVYAQDNALRLAPHEKLNDFIWTTSPHPHCFRRRAILGKYPEIQKLYGCDPIQTLLVLSTVFLQFSLSYCVSLYAMSNLVFFIFIYCISATLNHSLFAALHESSHCTMVPGTFCSDLFSIFLTLPMAVPVAIPFTRYHKDHHIYLGIRGYDPDLPTVTEASWFQSFSAKLVWIFLLPFTYSIRPMIVNPKPICYMDVVNIVCVVITDTLIVYLWGWRSFNYLLLGTFFSMNYHPFAGHFISEHYIFPGGDAYQETNSYYGFMNYFTYNLGYHVEHHDFPQIAGRLLPRVSSIAKEFYSMPPHSTWINTMWAFLSTRTMTPFNRINRETFQGKPIKEAHRPMLLHQGRLPYGGVGYFWPKAASE